jgi:N-acetyl-D-muramate 6-phosphate phosphatase
MVTAVVFDTGETLFDESRTWARWADQLKVPPHTFSAVLGATGDGAAAIKVFRPDSTSEPGVGEQIAEQDVYPDVRQCMAALNRLDLWVGLADNLSAQAAAQLTALKLPVDKIATSAEWGVRKPDPGFFERVIEMAPGSASDIVYVGDHRDNDIVPAKQAGLRTVLISRGPWGHLWAGDPAARQAADWVIGSLAELPAILAKAKA